MIISHTHTYTHSAHTRWEHIKFDLIKFKNQNKLVAVSPIYFINFITLHKSPEYVWHPRPCEFNENVSCLRVTNSILIFSFFNSQLCAICYVLWCNNKCLVFTPYKMLFAFILFTLVMKWFFIIYIDLPLGVDFLMFTLLYRASILSLLNNFTAVNIFSRPFIFFTPIQPTTQCTS